jgi:hypothetical protein
MRVKRPCHNRWVKNLPPDEKTAFQRDAKYKSRYGISLDEYERLLTKQEEKCAVCRKHPTPGRRLCVDHDHETKEVRGLLCDLCNRTMGQAGDDPELLEEMARYLRLSEL